MEKSNGKQNRERKRERFCKEFKLEAIRLLELGQKPATPLALELNISLYTRILLSCVANPLRQVTALITF